MKSRTTITTGSPQNNYHAALLRCALSAVLLLILSTSALFAGSDGVDLLTPTERAWLIQNHSRLVLAVESGYPPFVFIDSKDQPTGLAHDYLLLLEVKLGVHFTQKRFSSLDDIFAQVKSGDVSIVNAVTKTPLRSTFIAFTDPFITVPNVIIVRKERSADMRETDLNGLKVSLVKSYAATEQLTNKQLGFEPDLVANDTVALLNVSFGRSDAAVVDLATASYLIAQKGITNLRVAGETASAIQLSLGVPRSEQMLRDILQKGLAAITDDERREISTHWINTSAHGVLTDKRFWLTVAGGLVFVIGIFSAILIWNRTLRRQVVARTDALANEKAFLRSLIDSADDLIYFKDSNGVYIGCNKASEAFIGMSEHEQIGKTDFDFFDSRVAGLIHERDQQVISGATPVHAEEWAAYPDGRRVLLDTVKAPIYGSGGQPIGIVGISRDITERKRADDERQLLEQQFHHAQKLESLGVLAGGIAHDFNNILTVILGHCYMASENFTPEHQFKSAFQKIETAANRAAELCRQMLTYAGKSPLVQTRVNLPHLVDEVVKMLQSAIAKNVTITQDLHQHVPEIRGDVGQIQQIVMNLIINAAEAVGDANGTITVVLSQMDVAPDHAETDTFGSLIQPGRYVCLGVADSGCGMDEETQKRIFEPFYTTKFTGRGLGMSAIQGIVKAHGGIMHLSSNVGVGTVFKVCFPLSEESEQTESTDHEPASPQIVNGSILLVEDEEMLRVLGDELLKMLGFSSMTAANGREALEIYREQGSKISVILLDLIMPEMGGVEAYHLLRAITPTQPIIFCSGYTIEAVAEFIEHDPYVGFVHKPYRPEELRSEIAKVLAVKQGEEE